MNTPAGQRSAPTERVLRVLVVDDSAVAREVLSTILKRDGFEVTTTSSAESAAQKLAQQRPDVMVLDLQLPGTSGLEFLEQIMRTAPLPVVVCSGIAQPGASAAIRALELGALDVIPKPDLGIRALLAGTATPLGDVVRAAASARSQRTARVAAPIPELDRVAKPLTPAAPWRGRVILIGASTGGTEAIREVLSGLPANAPPVVIVQHMPAEYTGAFARRLNAFTPLQVREAVNGDVLAQGLALVAPGGRQIELTSMAGMLKVRVFDGPPVTGHRPSVDSLFRSAARALGERAVAALLTGMGSDGADGLLHLRQRGAETIAQDEATCVVYGMPKEAVTRQAALRVLPLESIAAALLMPAPQ
jgi:two-component system chemotaxis response regulator CheB